MPGPVTLCWLLPLVPVLFFAQKHGARFLNQFFLSPFQLFILLPWALAYFCVLKGFMPMKRGGKIERAADPASFWMGVGFYVMAGAAFYVLNLYVTLSVLARAR